MNKRRILLPITVFLVATFLGLFFSPFFIHKQPSPEVKAVAEQPAYIPTNYKNLGNPYHLLILPDGNIWYTDVMNGRIVKINQSGDILRTVGRYGTGEGEFDGWLAGITRDPEGNLYVQTGNFTYKLDFNGGFITSWGGSGNGDDSYSNATGIHYDAHSNALFISDSGNSRVKKHNLDGTFISQFGTNGSGNGQFLDMQAITTDSNGRIYVTDSEPNCRVEVFNPAGSFLFTVGSCGDGDGLFTVPRGVTIRSNGDIIVASAHTNSIQEFDSEGNWIRTFMDNGDNAWQFKIPFSVTFDTNGNYYIVDFYHRSIQKYTSNRVYVSSIRNSGFVSGRLTSPMSEAYDSAGNLYVLDNGAYDGRVQKFTNSGTYLATIVEPPILGLEAYFIYIKNDQIYIPDNASVKKFDLNGNLLLTIGTGGTGDGQFSGARGVVVDSAGNIYVSDTSNHRIQKFDSSGNYLSQWGTWGTGNDQFAAPSAALAMDSSENIYVPDNQINYEPNVLQGNTRIQVFNTGGVYQRTIGSFGEDPGEFIEIGGIAFDSEGKLHVSEANPNNPKIQVFNADGSYSHSYGAIGSGVEELSQPFGLALNPISENISIADAGNHRVQLIPSGTRIYNLISSADVLSTSDSGSLVYRYYDPQSSGVDSISSRLYFGEYIVSDFSVNLSADRDWTNVNVLTLPNESTSLVVNLDPSNAPGISATHSLYIIKQAGQTKVHVCPNAVLLEDVSADCTGGYDLAEGAASLSTVVFGGKNYWKVTGLTGTGIMSTSDLVTPTPTATATPSVTGTATPTPTPTATVTPTPTTTVRPTSPIIAVVTLPPVGKAVKGAVPACPTFTSFSASETLVKNGESVTFKWETLNTEVVRTASTEKDLPPIGELIITPTATAEYSFTADNGFCTAKKTITIMVVETLPWTNTITVGTGMLAIEAVIALQQPAIFGNVWLAIAGFFSKKKRQTWGIVYNSTTKKPLGRVIIRLLHPDNSVADTVVSEANGTFRLTPKIGKYTVTATLPGFIFPSLLVITDNDGGYNNVYRGQEVNIEDTSKGILLSIPLDEANLSEAERRKISMQNGFTMFIETMSNLLIFGGLMYGIYVAYVYPHLYNYIILGVYTLVILLKAVLLLPKKNVGTVRDAQGNPMAGLEIGLFDTEFKNLLYRTFTNDSGEYSFVVPNATFNLKLMDSRYRLVTKGELLEGMKLEPKGKDRVRVITQDLTLE